MHWEGERYVRLYKRDTADWLALSFDAQGLFCLLLRKVDRSGRLELGRHGQKAVAVVLSQVAIWETKLKPALDELLADGCVQLEGERLLIRNYVAAQEALASGRLRSSEWRERRQTTEVTERQTKGGTEVTERHKPETERHEPVTTRHVEVTRGDTAQRAVTRGDPSLSSLSSLSSLAEPEKLSPGVAALPPVAQGNHRRPSKKVPATAATWEAYRAAYSARYGVDPVRNATVNGQLAQLAKRLGPEEAPAVAAFYVAHAGAFYASKGHAVGPLLADCEKLHTEWATGHQITATAARQRERTQANAEAFAPLLKGDHVDRR